MNWKESWKMFWKEEEGLGTLEMIMIVAVILILAVAFRKWIIGWFEKLLGQANNELKSNTDTVDATLLNQSN
ncbi:Flp1 family type IVb pilin [Paenibacillus gansuensis]|uniref:Flp1 family type IVb pilin n=1 Tax=Paenibacillus gansuensis TaxID=306542 RepID=A0ABW5PCG8_9BACL